jgi:hypothetical protein
MYRFKIKKQEAGGYKFELDDIKLLVDDYRILDDKHQIAHPDQTIAYFNFDNYMYGIGNISDRFLTAEAFYDAMKKQYQIFTKGKQN